MDYSDDVKYPVILAEAAQRGIVVNTIRCGNDAQTELAWRSIAAITQGKYFSVEQSGSAIAMATPYDVELAKLSADLDGTRLYYGNEEERAEKQLKIAATEKLNAIASDAVKARRAAFNVSVSGDKNLFGDGDLVAAVVSGAVKLDEVDTNHLPAPLQAMTPQEREDAIRANGEQRLELKRQIGKLSEQRAAYLAAEVASDDKEGSLDHQIFETVRDQAGKKGLAYPDAPTY